MFMKKPLLFSLSKESFVDSDRRFTYLFQSHLKHLVICMLLILGSILQGYSQNFINGSFTGTKGDNVAAPGWTIVPPTFGTVNTPDINDAIGTSVFTTGGYNWTGGTPVASPDGGTWQNLFSTEKITQTVTGLTIGKTYSFSYYYTTQGIVGFPASLTTYVTPMLPNVTITGATGYTNPTSVGTLFQWQLHTSVITATATSATFTFLGPTATGYLAYDGASLVSSCNAGTVAPTVSSTTVNNACPGTTANLSSVVTSTPPAGTSLFWTDATGAAVATPSAASTPGIYYVSYKDMSSGCTSPTTAVTLSIVSCTPSPTCDGVTVTSFPATVNGINITASATGNYTNTIAYTAPFCTGSIQFNANGYLLLSSGTATAATLTYTFSKPVNDIVVLIDGAHASTAPGESYTFTTNTGTLTTTSGVSCFMTKTGNNYKATNGNRGSAMVQLHSTSDFTSITINGTGSPANSGSVFALCSASIVTCNAGTTAPTLSATTKSNVCPAATADISSLVSSTCPSGSSLEWHTVSTGLSASNKVADPTTVGAGTYYPVCYDATAACYSPTPATGVTVTITTCTSPFAITQPPVITKLVSTPVTGTALTDVIPTSGTGTITYSNGSTDPLCVQPVGTQPLPASSNLTINSTTGAYSYTTPTIAGTYYFCVKVCDSSSPTAQCRMAIYKVIVTGAGCAVGSAIPGVN
jgi:hypothetical protein